MSEPEPATETLEAELERLRAELAELRRAVEARDGELLVLRSHAAELQQLRASRRVPKPMPAHSVGNA